MFMFLIYGKDVVGVLLIIVVIDIIGGVLYFGRGVC